MLRQWQTLIDSLLAQTQKANPQTAAGWKSYHAGQFPLVNVYLKGEDGLTLTAEIPGMDKADLSIEVKGSTLRLAGKRLIPRGADDKIHYRERGNIEFDRSLLLPFVVDANKVEAHYQNGVLTLHLERAEEDKPKKIVLN